MLCIALESNAPSGNNLPVAAINNQTAVVDTVVDVWCNAICYIAAGILKHLDLSNLWHTCIYRDTFQRTVLTTDHSHRQHAAIHHQVDIFVAAVCRASLECKILHSLKRNCHTLGVVLVVVRHVIFTYKSTVGVEIVLATLYNKFSLHLALTLSLDSLEGLCELLGHVLTSTGHDTKITCVIDFFATATRCKEERK